MTKELLRAIPAVHELLDMDEGRLLAARTSREHARDRLRAALDLVRVEIAAGLLDVDPAELVSAVFGRAASLESHPSLRRVINATGVVLHTNLGRAPLSDRAIRAVSMVAGGYSNLEYDLDAGRRGRRDSHGESVLCDLVGCEAAVVANNNAAAVMLVLNTLASGGEVIVSRGELVEIGGGFRVPEVLERAGCTLREVGTTNRTRVEDYEAAINERTRVLLRVHPSNFRIIGFTSRPDARDLAEVARRHGLPFVDDLGSGCMFDAPSLGLGDETRVADAIAAGADIVTFSGDKLLGGPQAGIITGRAVLVERIRSNPLMRALRVDKMVYAALEATLAAYVEGRATAEIPALRMLAMPVEEIRSRASALAGRIALVAPALRVTLEDGRSVPGAGSAPGIDLPTVLVAIEHPDLPAEALAGRLRTAPTPVIGRIENDRLVLDLRTVPEADEPLLVDALLAAGTPA